MKGWVLQRKMKKLFFISLFFPLMLMGYQAKEDVSNITSGGDFSIVVSERAGHRVPAVDFFRRFERVMRRIGRIEENAAGRSLLLVLDEKQPSGSCSFEHSRLYRKQVLKLPVDYRSLLEYPAVGRVIASALLQSRLGNPPQQPLPPAARWIADGLWAEFVHREYAGDQLVHFTWLPELRSVIENGGKVSFNSRTLASPENIRPGSAEWVLYCQKARLMLEMVHSLSSSRNNLLKDYCFLLFAGRQSPEDCFDQTFGTAARRKLFSRLTPQEIVPEDEKTAGRYALDRLALKSLYSQYVPMLPAAAGRIFKDLCKITFKQGPDGVDNYASITDLPFLVEKYESCVPLPRIKIFELNELAAIAPAQLRNELFRLSFLLGETGSQSPEDISKQMKGYIDTVNRKIEALERVDNVLQTVEKAALPLLFEQRFFMNENFRQTPLTRNIESFWDTVERSLQR